MFAFIISVWLSLLTSLDLELSFHWHNFIPKYIIFPWQLSTWYIHGSLTEISKSKGKKCQQTFFPHQPALPDTHLRFPQLGKSVFKCLLLFSCLLCIRPEDMCNLINPVKILITEFYSVIHTRNWEATFSSSGQSLKYISNSSTLLHCLGHNHHYLSPGHNSRLQIVSLSISLSPPTHSLCQRHRSLFPPVSTPPSTLTFLCLL